MKILYQSPNYDPNKITNQYLHIDLESGKPVISETVKTRRSNYTYRSYELPKQEYAQYADAILKAQDIMHTRPNAVEIKDCCDKCQVEDRPTGKHICGICKVFCRRAGTTRRLFVRGSTSSEH